MFRVVGENVLLVWGKFDFRANVTYLGRVGCRLRLDLV